METLLKIFSEWKTAGLFILFIILCFGWLSIAGYAILSLISRKGISYGKWSIGGKDTMIRGHESCPKVSDWFLAIDVHREHTRATIDLVSSQSVLAEQKKFARELSIRLVNTAEKRFRELLLSRNMIDITFSKEYAAFVRYVDDVRRYCFELLVEAFEDNGFAKKTDKAFEDYLKTKVANIVDETVSHSFKILPDIFHDFDGYQNAMKGMYSELSSSLELSLRTARQLAIEKKEAIDTLDQSFTEKQKQIITGTYRHELPV